MNNLSEQFSLLQKAKRLEKIGNSSEALRVYLELHKDHSPNTFDSFERPIILLEKFKRYDEAIVMCEKAIALVHDGKISGTVERFEHRLERIHEKNTDSSSSNATKTKETKKKKEKKIKIKPEKKKKIPKAAKIKKEKKTIKKTRTTPSVLPSTIELASNPETELQSNVHTEKLKEQQIETHSPIQGSLFKYENMFKKKGRTFSPLPPGFRSRKKQNMIIASIVYTLGLILALPDNYYLFLSIAIGFMAFNYFIDLLGYKVNNKHIGYTLIAFIISIAILSFTGGSAIYNESNTTPSIASESEGTSSEGNGQLVQAPRNENDLPLITENHTQIAIDELIKEAFVKDAKIVVEDETVSFGILVELGTSTEEAKELGKTLVRTLSSIVASNYSDLDGPNKVGYGDLFNDYSAMVTVGTSSDDIITYGQKSKKSIGFTWQVEK